MKTKFIGGEKVVWNALRSAFGKGHRADVAVAFLGSGATARLRLSKGSMLVVNASEEAVRNGLTDPREIKKFRRMGVRVFSDPSLHAKVFVLNSRTFVGSANVSSNSADQLAEAIITTNDPGAVTQARRFVRSRAHSEIGPEYLKNLLDIPRPHRPPGLGSWPKDFIWAIHLPIRPPSDEALVAMDRGEHKAKRKLRNSRCFYLDTFQLPRQNYSRISTHDYVLQHVREGRNPVKLYPIGRVVYIESFQENDIDSGIVFLECRKGIARIALKRFKAQVGDIANCFNKFRGMKKLTHRTLLAQLRRKLGSKR